MDLRKLKPRVQPLDISKAANSGGLTFAGGVNPYKKPKKERKGPWGKGTYSNGVGVGY